MLWHPDRFSNEEDEEKKANATKRFQIISKAYTVLSDPEKRKLYDSTGEHFIIEVLYEILEVYSYIVRFHHNNYSDLVTRFRNQFLIEFHNHCFL